MSKGLTTEEKQALVGEHKRHESDSGSTEVQVAILSERIKQLTAHVNEHKKDNHTRLGLRKLVSKRRRLLKYLEAEDFDRYKAITDKLGIRR